MNWTRHVCPEAKGSLLVILLLAGAVRAPAAGSALPFADDYARGVERLLEGDAPQAATVLQRIVAEHGDNAEILYGPVFGNVLYNLGAALQQIGQYDGAVRAFERCFLYFPNEPDAPAANHFHALSLGAWAATEQARQRYAEAARLYARALKIPDSGLHADELLLNLAICLARIDETDAALRLFHRLLDGSAPDPLRLQAFLQLARHHIERGERDRAAALLDRHAALHPVMQTHGLRLNPTVLYLAARCTYQQDPRQALRWYRWLAPDPNALDPARSPDLHAALLGQSHAWFQLGAYPLAHAGYAYLAGFPAVAKHEEILLAASFSAAYLDRFDEAADRARELRARYPRFSRWPDAYILLTDRLLRAGRPHEALAQAESARDRLPATHPARESLDFAVASALYHLEAYPAAQSEFTRYLEAFPEAERAAVAHYSLALCLFHAAQWNETIQRLTEFLAAHPESPLADGALYHRAAAAAQLALRDDAIADLEQLHARHPSSEHLSLALNLLGDLRWQRRESDAALAAFAAVPVDPPEPAAYSLRRRVEIHVALDAWHAALDAVAILNEQHPRSPELVLASAAAIGAYPPLQRTDEGLAHLETLLVRHAGDVQGHTLHTLLRAYETLCKNAYGYSALLQRLADLSRPDPPAPRLDALLLLARIDAHESLGGADVDATIAPLYAQIVRETPTAALPDSGLLKLARWLRARNRPEPAARYYAALAERPLDTPDAAFGRVEYATLLAEQGDPDAALLRLDAVLLAHPTSAVRESATLETARLLFREREWERAADVWRTYLDHPDWLQARAEATYRLGSCLDRLGRTDEALAMYVTSYVTYEGQINWASPAFLRSALIERERGDPDRALAILDDMMDRMGHLSHPIVNRARTLHQQWRQADASTRHG